MVLVVMRSRKWPRGAETKWAVAGKNSDRAGHVQRFAPSGKADQSVPATRHSEGSASSSRALGPWERITRRWPYLGRLFGIYRPGRLSHHPQFTPMASLRSVCRAPLRQLGRPSCSAVSNHARLRQSLWRGYASTSDAQHKVCTRCRPEMSVNPLTAALVQS